MPTAHSRNLSQRLSRYIGLNEQSPWGRRAADLGINALKGHAPYAVKMLDFGEIAVGGAAAFAATPLNITATAAGAGSPTIVGSSLNGYVIINPGTTADTGYNLQWNVADVPSSLMCFYSTPNTAIAATRDIFWGAQVAFAGETAVWDGKVFMGLAPTDTALLTTADGTITQTTMDQGVGFHIGEGGTLSLVVSETTGNTITTCAFGSRVIEGVTTTGHYGTGITMNVKFPDATNGIDMCQATNSIVAGGFHDYFFHAHWGSTDATSANSWVEGYFDGKLVASIKGAADLPNLTAGDLFNTIEILNGGTRDCDMMVANILNAVPRLHIA